MFIFRIPKIIIPNLLFWKRLILDAFLLALLSYALAFSMAKILALENGYIIVPNQVSFNFFQNVFFPEC